MLDIGSNWGVGTTLSQNIPYMELTYFDILSALIVLVLGIIVAKVLIKIFKNGLQKTDLPELIVEFLSKFILALLYVAVLLATVSMLGSDISSVIVGLSAVIGLILGFGMQDTLTNIAAGIWIATLRPFDKGEFLVVNGFSGSVHEVGIMATELLTPDNKLITIPSKLVWGSPIVNATRMPTRRVDVDVGVSYDTKLEDALQVAIELMKENAMVLAEPAPAVVTTALADSSVNLQLRAWTNTEDYWGVKGALTNGILKAYKEEGIEIPFPQLDVHLEKE
ncbi:mechanosensitive ion channel family protein [Methanococcoides sp.]|uniref:mechanosensitive ion channel family protein n=1 Tax=Methanococcoides sp. TaxID=1966350 RepID=UPI00272E8926|nr:mechanosensitive ion channel family protein [Methanococcoides sp.]